MKFINLIALVILSPIVAASPPQDKATLSEVEGYFKALNLEAQKAGSTDRYLIEEFKLIHPSESSFSWEQIASYQPRNTKYDAPATDKWYCEGRFLLRRTYSDTLAAEDRTIAVPRKTFKEVEGALLSYQHDYNGGSDTWGMRGALIYSHTWSKDSAIPSGNLELMEAGLTPSITLNKFDSSGTATEVDQLTFRLGGWGTWLGGTPWFQNNLFLFATYSTDTSFDKSVYAGEFDIQPGLHFGTYAGLGSYHALWSPDNETKLGYQFDLVLHGEAGSVDDAGDSKIQTGGFFRAGPKLKLSVSPFFHKSLTWNSDYTYLLDIHGDNEEPSYLKTALIFSPNDAKNWAIQVEYEKGGLDLTKDEVDQITAGITVKF